MNSDNMQLRLESESTQEYTYSALRNELRNAELKHIKNTQTSKSWEWTKSEDSLMQAKIYQLNELIEAEKYFVDRVEAELSKQLATKNISLDLSQTSSLDDKMYLVNKELYRRKNHLKLMLAGYDLTTLRQQNSETDKEYKTRLRQIRQEMLSTENGESLEYALRSLTNSYNNTQDCIDQYLRNLEIDIKLSEKESLEQSKVGILKELDNFADAIDLDISLQGSINLDGTNLPKNSNLPEINIQTKGGMKFSNELRNRSINNTAKIRDNAFSERFAIRVGNIAETPRNSLDGFNASSQARTTPPVTNPPTVVKKMIMRRRSIG